MRAEIRRQNLLINLSWEHVYQVIWGFCLFCLYQQPTMKALGGLILELQINFSSSQIYKCRIHEQCELTESAIQCSLQTSALWLPTSFFILPLHNHYTQNSTEFLLVLTTGQVVSWLILLCSFRNAFLFLFHKFRHTNSFRAQLRIHFWHDLNASAFSI
jgi:hypothetical protein